MDNGAVMRVGHKDVEIEAAFETLLVEFLLHSKCYAPAANSSVACRNASSISALAKRYYRLSHYHGSTG
jgi:hypothetical protein